MAYRIPDFGFQSPENSTNETANPMGPNSAVVLNSEVTAGPPATENGESSSSLMKKITAFFTK